MSNDVHKTPTASAAFEIIQSAFVALVKKGFLSRVEAEEIVRQAIEAIKTGDASDQPTELLAGVLAKLPKP